MTPVNSIAGGPEDFLNIPVRTGQSRIVYIRDVVRV